MFPIKYFVIVQNTLINKIFWKEPLLLRSIKQLHVVYFITNKTAEFTLNFF